MNDYDYCHKVIVIGDSAVGKTSLLRRYVDRTDPMQQHLVTLGVDFKMKTLSLAELGGKTVKMQFWRQIESVLGLNLSTDSIWCQTRPEHGLFHGLRITNPPAPVWDTAGQEKFDSISKSFWRGARGVVILFAVDNRASFEHVKKNWYPSVQELLGDTCHHVVLVGNKCDVGDEMDPIVDGPPRRQVSRQEAAAFASEQSIVYIETSALADVNVHDMFYAFCLAMSRKFIVHELEMGARTDESLVKVQQPSQAPPDIVRVRSGRCGC